MVRVQADRTLDVVSDPEISGGTPVFCGTRVPVKTLFDYLEGGETLDRFLDQFRRFRDPRHSPRWNSPKFRPGQCVFWLMRTCLSISSPNWWGTK